ncbi:hypothetical protein VPH35_118937 [Triticum aestivum]
MLRLGDASLRPEEDYVVVPATPEMQAESALLSTNGAVAWLEGARQDVSCQQHHCALAVSLGHLPGAGYLIYVKEWRLEAHADNEDQLHHVRLCLEGVPLHGWNNYVATFLIGRGCSLDYIEQRSLKKEDTRDMALWAWTADPNTIPKVKWLTLPARGHRRRRRRGLRHRVLIHLDLHEDHTKARDDDDNPPPPEVHEFTWYRKRVDGTYIPRERQQPQGGAARRPDRRDDDDDRDGRRGRDGGRAREGWGAGVRRSPSRNARDRQRDEGQERTRERVGGRRRDGGVPSSALAPSSAGATPAVLRGSGSGNGVAAHALELLAIQRPVLTDGRGRSPVRQLSPRSARRRSQDERTPPVSTSVLPPSPVSKRAEASRSPLLQEAPNQPLLQLCSPVLLQRPLLSPSRPPGFQTSPTPPLACDGPLQRTPSPVHGAQAKATEDLLEPLFEVRQQSIFATPPSPPPRPPTARRKTLAGVHISRKGGLLLQRNKHTGASVATMPATKVAEKMVCRMLGITRDGKVVTEATLEEFTSKFKDQLAPEVIMAMREFFHLDDPAVNGVEDALIEHGEEGALELAQEGGVAIQDA